MRIADLYKPNDITITEAPVVGPSQPLGLSDPFVLDQLENTGYNVEGYFLWSKKFGDDIVFALKDKNDETLTVLVGRFIDDFPAEAEKSTMQVIRSWTPPDKRRQGYSMALYYGLSRLSYRLISDTQQSQEVTSLWKKLQRTLPNNVKTFNVKTGQYTDENPHNNQNVVYVLESLVLYQDKNSILLDSVYFTADTSEEFFQEEFLD
jgi:hypothetical protein